MLGPASNRKSCAILDHPSLAMQTYSAFLGSRMRIWYDRHLVHTKFGQLPTSSSYQRGIEACVLKFNSFEHNSFTFPTMAADNLIIKVLSKVTKQNMSVCYIEQTEHQNQLPEDNNNHERYSHILVLPCRLILHFLRHTCGKHGMVGTGLLVRMPFQQQPFL